MSDRTIGDTAPPLSGTVNANLTGSTCEVHVQRPDGTVFSHPVTPDAGTTGAWSCPLEAGDLTVGGRYLVELQVTFSAGGIQTFAQDANELPSYFHVRDRIE